MGDCFMKITEAANIFGLLFSKVKVMHYFFKCLRLYFGRFFSQTHLVILHEPTSQVGKVPM
jgi:hypothetical protein